ncbi:MAG: hypothetical protein PVI71_01615 [Desulfobacterales bacterium]
MKQILYTLVIISLSGFVLSSQALAGKIEQRQVRQHKRIWHGNIIRSG